MQIVFQCAYMTSMSRHGHFGWLKIAFLAVLDQYAAFLFLDIFLQNCCRRPFWMTKNHFWSHCSPFQINTQLFFSWNIFTKCLPETILDDRKSLLIPFLAISDKYAGFHFFYKMAAGGHFGWPKITFDCISRHFNSILNFVLIFFFKMAAGGHFGWPKITFDHIYHHFRLICSFFFIFLQNGRRRPFWMTENHFWSHFSPFQINTQLFFFGNRHDIRSILYYNIHSLRVTLWSEKPRLTSTTSGYKWSQVVLCG